MALLAPYATAEELEAYWRTLSVAEKGRATVLLGYAATLINEQPGAADANGDPAFRLATAKHISLDMVKRAMLNGEGVSAVTQSMADMSHRAEYTNPVGSLYLSAWERDRLAGKAGQAAGSVALSSNARVPGQPWNYQPSSQV